MNLKHSIAALILFLSNLHAPAAVLITNFVAPDFDLDEESSIYSTLSSGPTGITLGVSSYGDTLVGSFASVDITGLSDIILTGAVNGANPNAAFTITLYNAGFTEYQVYSGTTDSFGELSTSLTLSADYHSEFFDDSAIVSFQFTYSTDVPLSFTFENLSASATPEPSTWVLLIGGVAVAGAFRRSRRERGGRWLRGST
ncbi:MAG: hypothetical protein B9S32_08020 [Verrucomicrobia bacterium Tous-C9LFEB]|nr:MAG: hypothetical protein B9S32_08020 [Verrucomicrobia bacterium Tous-C9LFEB]